MKNRLFLCACWITLLAAAPVQADVSVTGLFSDHMVLQRDTPVPVWGMADAGEQVTVTVAGISAKANADAQGHWRVRLDALPAGGPHQLTIAGNNTITLNDVLVGEVWLCSGQSNMAFPVQQALNAETEIAAADYPRIRLLTVARTVADEPGGYPGKEWAVCSPATVGEFSAVAYFFGRDLHKTLNVPIGLIRSAVGGTPSEAWTPMPILKADPAFKVIFDRWEQRFATARAAEASTTDQPGAQQNRGEARGQNRRAAQQRAGGGRNATRPASRPAASLAELQQNPQRPAVLYNGMIHPLVPYAIRGAIWYQGEANAKYAFEYRKLFPTMIRAWREVWGQGDFPFLFVQLASWNAGQREPYRSTWAELREAQTMTLALPATAMAVATDVGDPEDIHPKNKQEVGRRLALGARAIVYGEKIPYSGPMYQSMSVDGDRVRLRFTHADGGLAARGGGGLKGFGIAGENRQFVDAKAEIDGDSVVVSSEEVPRPVAVRYAWADVPDDNLINGAGLPASPFRTDDWPGITANEK